ncbi:hypothetical protein D3C81_1043210 [compost metagenome]
MELKLRDFNNGGDINVSGDFYVNDNSKSEFKLYIKNYWLTVPLELKTSKLNNERKFSA